MTYVPSFSPERMLEVEQAKERSRKEEQGGGFTGLVGASYDLGNVHNTLSDTFGGDWRYERQSALDRLEEQTPGITDQIIEDMGGKEEIVNSSRRELGKSKRDPGELKAFEERQVHRAVLRSEQVSEEYGKAKRAQYEIVQEAYFDAIEANKESWIPDLIPKLAGFIATPTDALVMTAGYLGGGTLLPAAVAARVARLSRLLTLTRTAVPQIGKVAPTLTSRTGKALNILSTAAYNAAFEAATVGSAEWVIKRAEYENLKRLGYDEQTAAGMSKDDGYWFWTLGFAGARFALSSAMDYRLWKKLDKVGITKLESSKKIVAQVTGYIAAGKTQADQVLRALEVDNWKSKNTIPDNFDKFEQTFPLKEEVNLKTIEGMNTKEGRPTLKDYDTYKAFRENRAQNLVDSKFKMNGKQIELEEAKTLIDKQYMATVDDATKSVTFDNVNLVKTESGRIAAITIRDPLFATLSKSDLPELMRTYEDISGAILGVTKTGEVDLATKMLANGNVELGVEIKKSLPGNVQELFSKLDGTADESSIIRELVKLTANSPHDRVALSKYYPEVADIPTVVKDDKEAFDRFVDEVADTGNLDDMKYWDTFTDKAEAVDIIQTLKARAPTLTKDELYNITRSIQNTSGTTDETLENIVRAMDLSQETLSKFSDGTTFANVTFKGIKYKNVKFNSVKHFVNRMKTAVPGEKVPTVPKTLIKDFDVAAKTGLKAFVDESTEGFKADMKIGKVTDTGITIQRGLHSVEVPRLPGMTFARDRKNNLVTISIEGKKLPKISDSDAAKYLMEWAFKRCRTDIKSIR